MQAALKQSTAISEVLNSSGMQAALAKQTTAISEIFNVSGMQAALAGSSGMLATLAKQTTAISDVLSASRLQTAFAGSSGALAALANQAAVAKVFNSSGILASHGAVGEVLAARATRRIVDNYERLGRAAVSVVDELQSGSLDIEGLLAAADLGQAELRDEDGAGELSSSATRSIAAWIVALLVLGLVLPGTAEIAGDVVSAAWGGLVFACNAEKAAETAYPTYSGAIGLATVLSVVTWAVRCLAGKDPRDSPD
jgi:hypothetical protein